MGIFNLSVVLPQLFASLVLGRVILASPDKSVIFMISAVALALSAGTWFFVRDARLSCPVQGVDTKALQSIDSSVKEKRR